MRRILFFTCGFILSVSSYAQNWQSVGGGLPPFPTTFRSFASDTSYLYVGLQINSSPAPHPLRKWNGIQWDTLGSRCSQPVWGGSVWNTIIYQGKLTAMRDCGIFQWDGINWQPLATDAGGKLYAYGDTLFAIGGFDTINGIPASQIAKYNGTTWSAIDTTKWYGGFIMSAIIYQGELYIGGNMYNWNGTLGYIAKWNGTIWQTVGNSPQIITDPVECFEIYNNDLYVGVNTMGFKPSGIYKWDGIQWSIPGGGITGQNAAVYDMKNFNAELYACGRIEYAGGIPALWIAKWDGTNWCSLGDTIDNAVLAIEVYKNELYIAGGFLKINSDTMNYIAKWTGGNFTDSCGNTSGVNENNFQNEITIYPNPSSGIFTITSTEKISSIRITNILGEKVYSTIQPFNHSTIDISNHPNGIYFLQLKSENGIITRKIIKQ